MNNIFDNCKSLISLSFDDKANQEPLISRKDNNSPSSGKQKRDSGIFIFYDYRALNSNINSSDIKINIINMNNMFCGCNLLKSLPDISKWNTSMVKNMRKIFKGCKSLKSLPDIRQWSIHNISIMKNIFNGSQS